MASKPTAAKSAANPSKATKGEGMDPGAVSRMLGILKYKCDEKRNKGGENVLESNAALKVYASLNSDSKKRFLTDFETNGRGKGKQALKFVTTYEHKLEHDNSVEVGTEENFFTMPQILEINGLRWHDFKQASEAKTVATALIEDNKREHGHSKEPIVHIAFPELMTKFFYVKSSGIKRKETWSDREELTRKCDLKPGQTAELFNAASSSNPLIKNESQDYMDFGIKLTLVKSNLAALQKHGQQGDMLVRMMSVAVRKNPSLKATADELQAKMAIFNKHNDTVADCVAEMEAVTSDDPDLKCKIPKMNQLTIESDHHVGGFKEMYKRFVAILG